MMGHADKTKKTNTKNNTHGIRKKREKQKINEEFV